MAKGFLDEDTQKKIIIEPKKGYKTMKKLISDDGRIGVFMGGTATADLRANPGNASEAINRAFEESIVTNPDTTNLRKYFWEVDMSRPGNEFGTEIEEEKQSKGRDSAEESTTNHHVKFETAETSQSIKKCPSESVKGSDLLRSGISKETYLKYFESDDQDLSFVTQISPKLSSKGELYSAKNRLNQRFSDAFDNSKVNFSSSVRNKIKENRLSN